MNIALLIIICHKYKLIQAFLTQIPTITVDASGGFWPSFDDPTSIISSTTTAITATSTIKFETSTAISITTKSLTNKLLNFTTSEFSSAKKLITEKRQKQSIRDMYFYNVILAVLGAIGTLCVLAIFVGCVVIAKIQTSSGQKPLNNLNANNNNTNNNSNNSTPCLSYQGNIFSNPLPQDTTNSLNPTDENSIRTPNQQENISIRTIAYTREVSDNFNTTQSGVISIPDVSPYAAVHIDDITCSQLAFKYDEEHDNEDRREFEQEQTDQIMEPIKFVKNKQKNFKSNSYRFTAQDNSKLQSNKASFSCRIFDSSCK